MLKNLSKVRLFIQDICFDVIRHDDKHCYVIEGFGGQPVVKWPIYRFYDQYLRGNRDLAAMEYEAWYMDQITKYCHISKSSGGMKKGSLYKLIETLHHKKSIIFDGILTNANQNIIEEAIRERVGYRFMLLESIMKEGYQPNSCDRIIGVKKNGSVFLKGGHHRTAILKALGYSKVPDVIVYPSNTLYLIMKRIRKII